MPGSFLITSSMLRSDALLKAATLYNSVSPWLLIGALFTVTSFRLSASSVIVILLSLRVSLTVTSFSLYPIQENVSLAGSHSSFTGMSNLPSLPLSAYFSILLFPAPYTFITTDTIASRFSSVTMPRTCPSA